MRKPDSPSLMDEEWRPIPGYEGLYSISNLGRILSHERVVGRRRPRLQRERVLKPGKVQAGYLQVCLSDESGLRQTLAVHRLVAQAFLPNENNMQAVRHKDGNRSNNTASNLEWCVGIRNNHEFFGYTYGKT